MTSIYGKDSHLKKVREGLPEPTRTPSERYYSMRPISPARLFASATAEGEDPSKFDVIEKDTWVKILVGHEGTKFWAWKCLTDGKVYI